MKILLLQPPNQKGKGWGSYWLPSNLTGLAAVLEAQGYRSQVGIVDLLWNFEFEGVEELLRREAPDVVGITCVTNIRANAFKLARIVKTACPDATILMGGMYVTNMYEQILMNHPVDIAVIGEGERTLVELVKAFDKGKPVDAIQGIAMRRNGGVTLTPTRPFIKDLDSLPLPAYHLLDPANLEQQEGQRCEYDLVLSRGCPFNCQFCSTSTQWGTTYRSFGVKKVVDLIEHLLGNFKTDFIVLNDDTLALKKERVVGVCQEILARNLKVQWYARTRVDLITREGLEWMKKAGCTIVSYGVESGSPTILKNINKKTNLKKIVETFRLTREVGIDSNATVMVGNPGETHATVMETEKLLDEIKPVTLSVGMPILYPGTELYELGKREKLIDDEYWKTDLLAPIYVGAKSIPRMLLYKWRMDFKQSLRQNEMGNFFKTLKQDVNPIRVMEGLKIASFNALKRVLPERVKRTFARSSNGK